MKREETLMARTAPLWPCALFARGARTSPPGGLGGLGPPCLLLIVFTLPLAAQDAAPYLIPQTVFVGDIGRLVVPLGPASPELAAQVLTLPVSPPGEPQIIRAELERRGQETLLLVDFKAFAPGIQRLPPIVIGSRRYSELEVTIASILETGGGSLILSPPAPALTPPGTFTLIYGGIFGLLFLVLALTGMGIWGIPGLRRLRERLRRRRVIRGMEKSRRLLLVQLRRDAAGGEEAALSRLAARFRDFLAFFTGMNCRAMTSAEFLRIPPLSPSSRLLSGPALQDLFSRWDTLRFRGLRIDRETALQLFEEVRLVIEAFDAAEREQGTESLAAGAPA